MCRYEIAITEDSYQGFPVKIIRVTETHSKPKDNRAHEEFFVVSTDLDMDAKEIREAAYHRWPIENNVFKRLNEHCGTKNVRANNQEAFLNFLRLICLGLAVFDLLIHQLKKNERCWAKLRNGRKATWKNTLEVLSK